MVWDKAPALAAAMELVWLSSTLVLVVIAITSLVLALAMRRVIGRPVRAAIAAMSAVADDRLDAALPRTDVVELAQMYDALRVFRGNVVDRIAYAERSAAAEAEAARLVAEKAEAAARERAERERMADDERAAAERARAREQAMIDDLRHVLQGAAAGDFDIRMAQPSGEGAAADMPRLVNGLLDAVRDGLSAVSATMSRLADGEVSIRMHGSYAGAFAALQADVNAAARQLDEALGEVSRRATDVLGDSSDLTAAASDLSARTERTAGTVAETTRSLEGMVRSIADTARLAAEARTSASDTEREARESDAVVRDAIEGMQEIKALSGRIGKTLAIIDDIAFQTNLLALNAGVEAARAGPAGRGFAIVASEVRALARKVAEAAQQIGDLVRTSSDRIEDGVGRVGRTGDTLEALGRRIRQIGAQIEEIADAAEAQSVGAEEMNRAMAEIDTATQQNAAMFEETTAANMSLKDAASRMLGLVRGFRTSQGPGEAGWGDVEAGTRETG